MLDLEQQLVHNTLVPFYKNEIETHLAAQKMWSKRGEKLNACGHLFQVIAVLLSFLAPALKLFTLSLVSGTVGLFANSLLHLTTAAYAKSSVCIRQVNLLLQAIHRRDILSIPDLTADNKQEQQQHFLGLSVRKSSSSSKREEEDKSNV